MKEEFINKIKDCSIEYGTGMGLIIGVMFMLVIPMIFGIVFTYKQSLLLSAIATTLFASIFIIKGLLTRKKLKSEGNWHEDGYCVEDVA